MVALTSVWGSPQLKIWSKYLLFQAIPMILLLEGCKTWTALLNKMEVFLCQNIWCILFILMKRIKEECIKNKHVRWMFYDIPRTRNMIAVRHMKLIGKAVQRPHNHPTQHMLITCCNRTQLTGWPFLHNKDHIVKTLCLLFAEDHQQLWLPHNLDMWGITYPILEPISGVPHQLPGPPTITPHWVAMTGMCATMQEKRWRSKNAIELEWML